MQGALGEQLTTAEFGPGILISSPVLLCDPCLSLSSQQPPSHFSLCHSPVVPHVSMSGRHLTWAFKHGEDLSDPGVDGKTLPGIKQSISKGPGAAHRLGGSNLGLAEEHSSGRVRRRLSAAELALSGNFQKMYAQSTGQRPDFRLMWSSDRTGTLRSRLGILTQTGQPVGHLPRALTAAHSLEPHLCSERRTQSWGPCGDQTHIHTSSVQVGSPRTRAEGLE